MRRDEDVAWRGFKKREALLEVFATAIGGALRELEAIGGDGAQTVLIDHILAMSRFAGDPCPARSSGSVTGCEVGGENDVSHFQLLTVVDDFDMGDGWDGADLAILRVIFCDTPGFEDGCAPGACGHFCAAEALQFRDASGVIEVDVGVKNELDVLETEAESANVGCDQRGGFGKRSVDEDMAVIGGDEDGTETVRADVVGVAVDAKGRLRGVPCGTVAAWRQSGLAAHGRAGQGQQADCVEYADTMSECCFDSIAALANDLCNFDHVIHSSDWRRCYDCIDLDSVETGFRRN